MAESTVQIYGFWGMLALLAFRDLIIPLANKIVPRKVNAGIDNERRMVEAAEQTAKILTQVVEIQRRSSEDHTRILDTLSQQSQILAVLLDRAGKDPKVTKKN